MRHYYALTCVGLILVILGGSPIQRISPQTQHSDPTTSVYDQTSTGQPAVTGDPVTPATLQPTGAATAISTAGWKTYMNFAYEFAIAYPPTMELENSEQVATSGGFAWIPLCNFERRDTSLVICFYLPRGTYPDTTNTDFVGASLAVNVINLNQQDCLSFADFKSGGIGEPMLNTINGIKFSYIGTGGGGMGHLGIETHNRTYAHNTCFELTRTIAITYAAEMMVWTSTPEIKPFTEANQQNVQAILDRMLSTFRFTSDFVSTPSS
jgi:hypothetical protein